MTSPTPASETAASETAASETAGLPTEQRHPGTAHLDEVDSLEVLRMLNDADRGVADAVTAVLPQLAALVDATVAALRRGGGVHYVGAGTSGRLAVLDAAELRPTFTLEPGRFVAHLAGGERALTDAVENAEDDEDAGAAAVASLGPDDVVVGIAASGRTPFVAGALRAARARGATTALVANVPAPRLAGLADHVLAVDTGPEVLTGSTRLKAGTATKMVLNGFSTAVMVGLGRTYSNLMVSLVATNAKLEARSVRVLQEITGLTAAAAAETLARADGELPTALVVALTGRDPAAAREALARTDGSVRAAVALPGEQGVGDAFQPFRP
ncbi:N-acetylmuramic acid 6-phosphate etherase [Kineococcus sp. R86509]|uniref:N-acetylmuramic acid 6-phosphate etherase n=1 Tax=Kineococcus sp. R86509 TaxID=3093851 RepID=UPI0036D41D6D